MPAEHAWVAAAHLRCHRVGECAARAACCACHADRRSVRVSGNAGGSREQGCGIGACCAACFQIRVLRAAADACRFRCLALVAVGGEWNAVNCHAESLDVDQPLVLHCINVVTLCAWCVFSCQVTAEIGEVVVKRLKDKSRAVKLARGNACTWNLSCMATMHTQEGTPCGLPCGEDRLRGCAPEGSLIRKRCSHCLTCCSSASACTTSALQLGTPR